MKKCVLILGAGLSGLSAAVHLILKGYQVTILEKRPYAGGRTFSFSKNFWPYPIDNGPHVLLGCYTALLELLEIVGSSNKLEAQSKLTIPYLQPNSNPVSLKTASFPAPFHFLFAILKFPLLNFKEKLSIVKIFLNVQKIEEDLTFDQMTAEEWLIKVKQEKQIMDVFWSPLILATLNTTPNKVSFLQLVRVLKIGFLQGKKESRMILMPEGLSEALINPTIYWLIQHKCEIKYRQVVKKLKFDNGKITNVITSQQTHIKFDFLISALPFKPFTGILHESNVPQNISLNNIESFETNAIMNYHFWYEGRLIVEPFAAFLNCTSQWLFVQKTNKGLTHYTIIVSGANEYLKKSKEEMMVLFQSDLQNTFSGFDPDKIKQHYLTIEKNATLHCLTDVEINRPESGHYFDNLFLAGDWTKTGLPPTMESAVLSGKTVAGKIDKLV